MYKDFFLETKVATHHITGWLMIELFQYWLDFVNVPYAFTLKIKYCIAFAHVYLYQKN